MSVFFPHLDQLCVHVGARESLTNNKPLRVYLGGGQMMKLCSSAPEDRLHDVPASVPDRLED